MTANKKGSALLTVLSVIFIVALAAAMLLKTSSTHLIISRSQVDGEKAIYVAEAGVERAASHLASDGYLPATFHGAIGDGIYCAVIIEGSTPAEGTRTVAGSIKINPNKISSYNFNVSLPGGSSITKSTLTSSYAGYSGPAKKVVITPGGSGTQSHIQFDGDPVVITNSRTYEITSNYMVVNVFNDKRKASGQAVGSWWVAIATTVSDIDISN